jgi:hypothetical protein
MNQTSHRFGVSAFINPARLFQTVAGIGGAFTDASAAVFAAS